MKIDNIKRSIASNLFINNHFFLRRIIQAADTADEFYCVMGQLSQEMLDYQASDSNKLIKVSQIFFIDLYQLFFIKSIGIQLWQSMKCIELFSSADSCGYFTFSI